MPIAVFLAGCSEEERYRVGGEVSGLEGSLTLRNSGVFGQTLTTDDTFSDT